MMVMIVYNYPEIINTQEETVPIVKTDKIDIAPVSALVEWIIEAVDNHQPFSINYTGFCLQKIGWYMWTIWETNWIRNVWWS